MLSESAAARYAIPGLVILLVTAAGCRHASDLGVSPDPVDTMPRPSVPAPPPPGAVRGHGPLSIAAPVEKTPWEARKAAMRRNDARRLEAPALDEDLDAFLSLMDTCFVPRTQTQHDATAQARHHVGLLRGPAPRSVSDLQSTLAHVGWPLDLCPRPPDELWHCDPDLQTRPEPEPGAPYRVRISEDGLGEVTLLDLTDASDPGWAGFDAEVAALSCATGIVVDLRKAQGVDPRPVLPWLEQLTGVRPLRPLRELHRPASLTPYVEAYAARYLTESRDPAVWRGLVGEDAPASADAPAPSPVPVAVVVGRDCESACELIARILETHTGAPITGGVPRHARLGRDEPAVARLPNSGVDVYFHATEYVLSEPIEAATGPTHDWQSPMDPLDYDGTEWARRLVRTRAKTGADWPAACGSYQAYPDVSKMPAPVRDRIEGHRWLADDLCDRGDASLEIRLMAEAPLSTLRRLLEGCPEPASISGGPDRFILSVARGAQGVSVLSRLAQSDLVQSISVDCEPLPQLH